uniref:Retrotransposon gag domain-containing protein n=1 Tax=Vitis vinifera TaxID=29760 RepID=A5AHL7_VITVI|nr:hypothetical protein VITISV_022344 [Vitis vinifera]
MALYVEGPRQALKVSDIRGCPSTPGVEGPNWSRITSNKCHLLLRLLFLDAWVELVLSFDYVCLFAQCFGFSLKFHAAMEAKHHKMKANFAAVRNQPFAANCACHIEYEIAEEAMNFMSYVAEVSREWGEPNAKDNGRMMSQPKAKGEMYILNDGMNMKAKIAAMERRLEELEMTNMQPVQAISQISLQAMPCAICLSYEHLVDECPTILAEREMFGDCNTYNSNWRDYPNFSWKPQPPQYQQPAQAPQQASNLEQAMMNLNKVMEDFVEAQKSMNAQLSQRIDSVESSLNKKRDEVQNDLSQKLDILQDSISMLANLNTMQEKENSPSQPYQNSMSIHEMEAEEGEPSQKREVKEVITLRSGKEVDLPTCKLEHKVESETEKEKREEIKGKKKGKSIEKDGYEVNVQREPQRIVIKELMKKHMPPPFFQALYGKIIQSKSQLKDANFIWDPGKLNQEQNF